MTIAVPQRAQEYLTVAEASAELGVSPKTIRRKIAAGQLPAVQLGGSGAAIRISRRALDAWLRTNSTGRREEAA